LEERKMASIGKICAYTVAIGAGVYFLGGEAIERLGDKAGPYRGERAGIYYTMDEAGQAVKIAKPEGAPTSAEMEVMKKIRVFSIAHDINGDGTSTGEVFIGLKASPDAKEMLFADPTEDNGETLADQVRIEVQRVGSGLTSARPGP